MLSSEEAKVAVLAIAKRYGYIHDLTGGMEPSLRAELEARFLSLESVAATSVKTGARFVFELLQNAEDNQFSKALETGQAPFISFHVYQTKVVIECNEDGFTQEDLSAICAVGESTKTTSHGYIGAKGIGFKSVFIAAWKVHIQSGVFSFKFEHKKGDTGLGMVRPEWVDTNEELDGPLTRITLSLHEDGNEADLQHERKIIFDQFHELERTCLLFLQKLQSVHIRFYDKDGTLEKATHFHKDNAQNNRTTLRAIFSGAEGSETVESEHYHVTRHTATGLARSSNRDEKIAADVASTADVVLAFQLTEDSKPVEKKQQVFAFLPMQESNFKFLIHSDFDTNANRQDIVTTSRRNLDLLVPIAQTLIKAVLQFCEDPELCYLWPHFLPLPEECSSGFWSSLYEKIKDEVMSSAVLRSRNRKDLRQIRDVYIAATGTEDSRGILYLDDPVTDLFISSKYENQALNRLKTYGLEVCNWGQLLKLLKDDLKAPKSKMRSASTDSDWHSGVARLFSKGLKAGLASVAEDLRKLSLLPLRDRQWATSKDGAVFFSTCEGVDIPLTIDLKILDSEATANQDREAFFKDLGASFASVSVVRSSIDRAYAWTLSSLNVNQSRAHLHFLFLTHHAGGSKAKIEEIRNVRLLSQQQNDRRIWTQPTACYLPGDSSYGPKALLEAENGAPGLDVPFVHSAYLQQVPITATGSNLSSWETWLRNFLGVQSRLPLSSPDKFRLSIAAEYVAEHRPDKFLGLLQYLWTFEGKLVLQNASLLKSIQGLRADRFCQPGFGSVPSLTLSETCVPSPELHSRADQYMEDSCLFPFLRLEDNQRTQQLSPKWSFLSTDLKIHHTNDFGFLCILLRRIRDVYEVPSTIRMIKKVCDLYGAIEAGIKTSRFQEDLRERVRVIFRSKSLVLVPSQVDGKASWSSLPFCVWRGPSDMQTKNSLRARYSKILNHDDMVMLDEFFKRTLEVSDATTTDVTAELRKRKQSSHESSGYIHELYTYLASRSQSAKVQHDLRHAFDQEALVYVSKARIPGWYRTSECLWTSTTEIRGKAVLEGEYENLKAFFVEKLRVRSLTMQMVYDELLSTTRSSSIEDTRSNVFAFNSLLQTEEDPLDYRKVREACIFPIRYPNGTTQLGSGAIDFAIGDRDYLLPSFAGKIKILSYSMEEVRRLTPFFEWTRLQNRYLSRVVKEDTSVADGAQAPISSNVHDLRLKAYHILRVAATFDSPKYTQDPHGLYRNLLATRVIETDRILSVLKVSQDNKLHKVEEKAGDEHINDTGTGLEIYVPMNKKDRDVSYGTTLPSKLAEWLMKNETAQIADTVHKDAIFALTLVMTTERWALDSIFERQGIIQVPIPDEDEEPLVEEDEEVEEPRTVGSGSHTSEGDTRSPPIVPSHDSWSVVDTPQGSDSTGVRDDASIAGTLVEERSFDSALASQTRQERQGTAVVLIPTNTDTRPSIAIESGSSTSQRRSSSSMVNVHQEDTTGPEPRVGSEHAHISPSNHPSQTPTSRIASGISTSAEEAQYRTLLDRVVSAARQIEDALPARGAFNMSSMLDALPASNETHVSYDGVELLSRFRSSNQLERDKKIGAAGELFVFEILSNQGLSNWSRENWQSNIRHYVTAHQDYTLLQPWRHRETTDLVYQDTEGRLTEILIDKGYLSGRWTGAKPKYFIEVKTTTGPCDTPFYMSGGQYQLMQRVHNVGGVSEIYLIVRVFRINLRPKVCIFIDPEELRQNNQLLFTGQTWAVVPGESLSS